MSAFTREQVQKLQAERTNDPLGRGYNTSPVMTDQQFADSLNTVDREPAIITLSAGQIFEQIVGSEFTALTAGDKDRVDRVLGLGAEIIVGPGNSHNAVQELLVFNATSPSITIQNLNALRDAQQISRAQEIGIPFVTLGSAGRTF